MNRHGGQGDEDRQGHQEAVGEEVHQVLELPHLGLLRERIPENGAGPDTLKRPNFDSAPRAESVGKNGR